MRPRPQDRRTAFTIVELLTVIAIIALLVGILVPAAQQARAQAKKASTQGQMSSINSGIEMYHNDFGRYPQSSGGNPFESTSYGGGNPSVWLSGAQWLLVQLCGPDYEGFVRPDKDRWYDSQAPAGINQADWLDWYSLSPSAKFHRFGPYVTASEKNALSPERYGQRNGFVRLPDSLAPGGSRGGASAWNNSKVPFFYDAFHFPILYYVSAEGMNNPFCASGSGGVVAGRYDQTDNAQFTGGTGVGRNPSTETGIDLGNGTQHPMRDVGWTTTNPNNRPPSGSFAHCVSDRAVFEQTKRGGDQGRVWPRRPDSFFLYSPGKDGLYGTDDDITNLN